jgi:hypothetical protein
MGRFRIVRGGAGPPTRSGRSEKGQVIGPESNAAPTRSATLGTELHCMHPVKAAAIARQVLKVSDNAHKSELPLHKAPETDRRILQSSITQNKLAARHGVHDRPLK